MNAPFFNDFLPVLVLVYIMYYIIWYYFSLFVSEVLFKDWAMNDKEEVVIFRQKSSSTDGEKTSGAKDVYVPNQIMGFYMVIAAPIVLRIIHFNV